MTILKAQALTKIQGSQKSLLGNNIRTRQAHRLRQEKVIMSGRTVTPLIGRGSPFFCVLLTSDTVNYISRFPAKFDTLTVLLLIHPYPYWIG